jgi:hypothetical protein
VQIEERLNEVVYVLTLSQDERERLNLAVPKACGASRSSGTCGRDRAAPAARHRGGARRRLLLTLLWDGRPVAVSVEHTFDDGEPVIRDGTFDCVRSFYQHGGYETFEIIVPGHTRVLFHKGNTEDDSLACVCVAESFSTVDGKTAVIDSKHGFEEFMTLIVQ